MAVKSKSKMSAHDPLSTGVGIAQQRFQNEISTPNEHDEDAQLFSNIGKAAGPKPRGWRALAAGLAQGAEYGAKTKSTAKKQEALSKYDKVMNYFEDVNNAAMERKAWYETREMAQQKYLPQVLSYAENVTKLDPQSQRMMAQGILDGWNRFTGDDFKLNAIDGSDPYIFTVTSKEGTKVMDIRDMFAGDDALQARLAAKMPEYQMQLQEKRQKLAAEYAFKQEDIDIKKYDKGIEGGQFGTRGGSEGAEDKEPTPEGYKFIPLDGLEKSARADYQKKVYADIEKIPTNQQAIETISEMKAIFNKKGRENIGNSLINLLDVDPKDENSWATLVARKFADKDELADLERLKKLASDLNLSVILSTPGKTATDIFKQAVKSAAPHGKLTKEGFDDIANKWEKKAQANIKLSLAKAEAMNKGKILVPGHQKSESNPTEDGSDDLSDLGTLVQ